MSIQLTAEQQGAIEHAIESGWVGSVEDFISAALKVLARGNAEFDRDRALHAGQRLRDLRRGVRLNLDAGTLRKLAHEGHKY